MRDAFFGIMNQWFTEFKQANPITPLPPPATVPPLAFLYPQHPVSTIVTRLLVDKIRKFGAEEFRGKVDDPAKTEYWLVKTKSDFVQLM